MDWPVGGLFIIGRWRGDFPVNPPIQNPLVQLFDVHLLDLKKAVELSDARGMAHFAKGLGFDLPDALTSHLKLPSDFVQGARIAVAQAEAQLQNLLFAFA